MNGVVLYIDDNEDNVFLLQRLFKHRRPDIQLHTAMTGRDGIKAAIDDQPTLILLDNRLPDINGEQVLLQLAAAPATAAIPVVILSGDSNPATVNELLTAGAADFLVKPFDIHQLWQSSDVTSTDRRGPQPGRNRYPPEQAGRHLAPGPAAFAPAGLSPQSVRSQDALCS